MVYLLDTNVWIHYFKNSDCPLRAKLSFIKPPEIATCSIVLAELLHGAEKYGSVDRRRRLVLETLSMFQTFAFDDQTAAIFAKLRHALEVGGRMIGLFDLQIAAIALQHECTLVTNNAREFSRVEGLKFEDWTVG